MLNAPFSVRPNPGSALERFVERQRENGEGMKRLCHDWAEKAERLAEQSQGREERE